MQDELIATISGIVTDIRDTLLDAGLNATAISFRGKKLEKATEKRLVYCHGWLSAFRAVYIRDYKKAKALVPQQIWDMYKSLGTKGTYEQIQLADAKKLMITEWRNRPDELQRRNSVERGTNKSARKAK